MPPHVNDVIYLWRVKLRSTHAGLFTALIDQYFYGFTNEAFIFFQADVMLNLNDLDLPVVHV